MFISDPHHFDLTYHPAPPDPDSEFDVDPFFFHADADPDLIFNPFSRKML
jgi:hypothetical protein